MASGTWIREQLPGNVFAKVRFGSCAGRDDAAGDGNQQRRDCRHQAVADGQNREALGGLRQFHVELEDADQESADDVDRQDDHAGNRVARRKPDRAVHRSVKFRFLGNLFSALRGLPLH